jgi:hypothetical protein
MNPRNACTTGKATGETLQTKSFGLLCRVTRGACLFLFCLLFAGCAQPIPAWIDAGHQQIETFKRDFLTGAQPLVTELHFKKGVEEIKKAGDLDRLGRAWLTRMALQAAALEPMEEGEYLRIEAAGPVAVNRNFNLFLKGELAAVDVTLLPEQYREIPPALRGGNANEAVKKVTLIEDPLSRLIAAAVALRSHPQNESLLSAAVETASRNGWKRVLLAWLTRQAEYYDSAGDAARSALILQRIELMKP